MKTIPASGQFTPVQEDPQALIEEARRLRRRRVRRGSFGAAVLAAAAVTTLLLDGGRGGGSGPPAAPKPASQAELRSFLAKAQRGTQGAFVASYVATTVTGKGVHRSKIVAAQDGTSSVYRATPGVFGLGASEAVYVDPISVSGQPGTGGLARGIYTCSTTATSNGCMQMGQLGMGTTNLLLGPYPPQQLFFELQNAVALYQGPHTFPAISRANAYLISKKVNGKTEPCLLFGSTKSPVATFCLGPHDLVAYMNAPSEAHTNGVYASATMQSFSAKVGADEFALPSPPLKAGPP